MGTNINNIDEAFAAFMDGARIHHGGVSFGDNKMALRGLKRTADGLTYIDENCANARGVLIPFLDHADDEVRVTAASALLQSRPDLAIPVIEHIRANSLTEAHMTAGMIMIFKEVFGHFGLGVATYDPRYPIPGSDDPARGAPPQ